VLQGFTVGITSNRFNEEQARYFHTQGASVVVAPCLAIRPIHTDDLRAATESIIKLPPDVVVAASATAVRLWFDTAESWGIGAELRRSLERIPAYSSRSKVRSVLEAAGLRLCPDPVAATRGLRAAVLVDGAGEAAELAGLDTGGADVVAIRSYDWGMPADRRPALRLVEGVIAGRVDAVVFTSRPAVSNWFAIATEEEIADPLRGVLAGGAVTVGCVGRVCAGALSASGVNPAVALVPVETRLSALLTAVADHLGGRVVGYPPGPGGLGLAIKLAGSTITIGDDSYSLTPVEARLLGALARRPNTVVSAEELMRAIWGGAAQGSHLVEVVASRLRRRLGVHGEAIEVLPRKGYALRV
jgi:uroporphyrinogen-III synthase